MTRYIVKEYGSTNWDDWADDFEYGVDYIDTKTGQAYTLQFLTDYDYSEAEITAKLNNGEFAEYMANFAEKLGD